MEISPVTPAKAPKVRTTKVRAAKAAVPKSSSTVKAKAPPPEIVTAATPRKRKTLTKKMAASTAAPVDLTPMIATAAYFMAEQRNFAPGYELQDWAAAEQLIRSKPFGK